MSVSCGLLGSLCAVVVWRCYWYYRIHLYQSSPVGFLCYVVFVSCSVGVWRISPLVISAFGPRIVCHNVCTGAGILCTVCCTWLSTLCHVCSGYFAPDLSGVDQSGVE